MQEQAQELTRVQGSVRQQGPAPEQVLEAQVLEAALELVLAQKLAPAPGWMPALALELRLALVLELMPPLGWASEAVLELVLAVKLVSETALEPGTGLQEIRYPLWLPHPAHFQDRRLSSCQRTSPCSHNKMLSQTMVDYLLGPRHALAPGPMVGTSLW